NTAGVRTTELLSKLSAPGVGGVQAMPVRSAVKTRDVVCWLVVWKVTEKESKNVSAWSGSVVANPNSKLTEGTASASGTSNGRTQVTRGLVPPVRRITRFSSFVTAGRNCAGAGSARIQVRTNPARNPAWVKPSRRAN